MSDPMLWPLDLAFYGHLLILSLPTKLGLACTARQQLVLPPQHTLYVHVSKIQSRVPQTCSIPMISRSGKLFNFAINQKEEKNLWHLVEGVGMGGQL